MNKTLFVPNSVTFSSQVTSMYVQALLLSKLQKKGKGRYGGPPGKSLVKGGGGGEGGRGKKGKGEE